jgi:hypothetical protein
VLAEQVKPDGDGDDGQQAGQTQPQARRDHCLASGVVGAP